MDKIPINKNNVDNTLMKSIVITPPIYSYVLIGMLVTCLFAIIWGIFGSIPQKVQGVGMINTTEGVLEVKAMASGNISEVKVKLDDTVKVGDVIAIIDQPELKFSIDQTKLSIDQLKQRKDITSFGNNKNTIIKTKSDNLAVSRLKANIEEINKSLLFYEKSILQDKELYEKGLITYGQYFSTQQELASVKMNKISVEEQLGLVTLNKQEWALNNNLGEINLESQLSLLELELEDLIKDYKIQTEVTAKKNGYITQLNVKKGDLVSPNYNVAIINSKESEGNYILNLYIPFSSNAFITKDMGVDIQLFSVDPYLYGYLKGKVKYISPYLADNDGLMSTIGNSTLIETLDSKGGVYSVIVELEKDPKTFNGYKWSNEKGPPIKIYPGQLSLGFVNVKVKAPIDIVLPIFKAYFD